MIAQIMFLALLVLVFGISLVLLFFRQKSLSSILVTFSLAFGVGAGASSILFFVWSMIFYPGYSSSTFLFIEILITLILIIAIILRTRLNELGQVLQHRINLRWSTLIFTLIFIISAAYAIDIYIQHTLGEPHGAWDAWAIWNLRARYIFFGGQEWKNVFFVQNLWSHPDYPLLLPSFIASFWTILNNSTKMVPALTAFSFYISTVALFFSSLWKSRGINHALVGSTLFVSAIEFINVSSDQYADVPLSFYFLASCVLLYITETENDQNLLLYLLGFVAGLAVWDKNEGISFVISLLFVKLLFILLASRKSQINAKSFLQLIKIMGGMLIPLIIVEIYKISFPFTNDLIGGQSFTLIISKITDFGRYNQIFNALWGQFINFGGWNYSLGMFPILFVYSLIVGKSYLNQSENIAFTKLFLILGITFLQYMCIYLITPYDLAWHLSTSVNRLVVQLFPSFLFVLFVSLNDPFVKGE
jgi:hypothetical protein